MLWTFFDTWQETFFQKICHCCLYSSRGYHRWKVCSPASSTLSAMTSRFISKISGEIFHITSVALNIMLYIIQLLQFLQSHFIVGGKVHLSQTAYCSLRATFQVALNEALFF